MLGFYTFCFKVLFKLMFVLLVKTFALSQREKAFEPLMKHMYNHVSNFRVLDNASLALPHYDLVVVSCKWGIVSRPMT